MSCGRREADEGGSSSHLGASNQLQLPTTTTTTKPPSCSSPEVQLDTSSTMHQLIAFFIFGGFGLCVAIAELSRLFGLFCKTYLYPRPSFLFLPSTCVLLLNILHMNLFLCRQLYVGFWRKQEVKAIDPNDAMDNL